MKARFRGGRLIRRRPAGHGMGWWLAVALVLGLLRAVPVAAQEWAWEGLSERFSFGEPAGLTPASGTQTAPSVACDSTLSDESWVVWEDNRLGDPDVFAARISAAGEVRDPSGLPIAVGPERQTTPRIAAGGGVFLTVWQATDPTQEEWRIQGVRLDPQGSILDATPLLLARSEYPLQDLDLAFGEESFMVVWSDTLGDHTATRGARVSAADGSVLDEEILLLSQDDRQQTGADLAFGGENYLLAYSREVTVFDTTLGGQGQIISIDSTDIGEIVARAVTPEGVPTGATRVIEPAIVDADYTNDDLPMLAYVAGRFLIVWPARDVGQSQTSNREIFGRTLADDGTLSARFGIAQALRPRDYRSIAASAGGFQLCWVAQLGQRTTYYGVHVGVSGPPATPEAEIVPLINNRGVEDPGGCSLVWNGVAFVFVAGVQYISVAGDDQDIRVSVLDTNGAVTSGPALVTQAAPLQIPRAVTFDGTRYLVVWDEQVSGGWQVRGAFVSETGTIDGESFAVLPETTALPRDPALAAGGGCFVLTWAENQNLYAAPIDGDGLLMSTPTLVSVIATGRPAIAWDGERFPVVFKYLRGSDQGVLMGRLTLTGTTLALADFRLGTQATGTDTTTVRLYAGTSSDPAVTCSGDQALFMWSRRDFGVYGLTVTDTTTHWSTAPATPLLIAAGEDPGVPRATFDGTSYFIGWSDLPETFAARLRPDGIVLDPGRIPLDPASDSSDRPAAAYDGANRLAVWRTSEGGRWTLVGGRFGSDGGSLAGLEVFADEDLVARWPLMVGGKPGQALFVYASYLADAQHGALRLHGRIWQQDPPSVDIALLQNPGVTSDVGIIATPSDAISAGDLTVYANGDPIEMELIDAANGIYHGWYQARATTVVRIVAAVGDSAGNVTRAERSFGIGEITPEDGGYLAGPNGLVALTCPPRVLASGSYVMILPDARGEAFGERGFLLSPPDLRFASPAALTVRAPARPAEASASTPVLERRAGLVWERVPATWQASEGTLRAPIMQLGLFRVRWTEAGELPGSRLALTLGPAPWRSDLTLRYRLPQSGPVELVVFDAAGRRVATLADGVQEGGREHAVVWDGRAQGGGPVGSGVYFARLRSGGQTVTRRSIRVQ